MSGPTASPVPPAWPIPLASPAPHPAPGGTSAAKRSAGRRQRSEAESMRSNDPTRGEVVRAAVALIDQNGLRGLTSRKISSHLGVQTRALARLFHDREELLDGIVEAVVDELYADPDVRPISCHWQEYLQTVAHGVRRAALAHPAVFPLIATRSPAAPTLAQPPMDGNIPGISAPMRILRPCRSDGLSSVLQFSARPSAAGSLRTGRHRIGWPPGASTRPAQRSRRLPPNGRHGGRAGSESCRPTVRRSPRNPAGSPGRPRYPVVSRQRVNQLQGFPNSGD